MENRKGEKNSVKGKPAEKEQLFAQQVNMALIRHATEIAEEIGAKAILAYTDVIRSKDTIKAMIKERRWILVARTEEAIHELTEMGASQERILRVPHLNMTRISQVKVAAMLAITRKLLQRNEKIVCLSGFLNSGIYNNLTILDANREFELFSSLGTDITAQMQKPHIFDRLLSLALETAHEGKEGKPLGTTFILGDHKKVMELSSQMAINPFAGVPEDQRNIMDPALKETLREFAPMDGAFVIRDDGVVLAAARHLNVSAETTGLPQGLGARHRSAAGITGLTDAIAIVISESTGAVRIFSRGRIFMEIEKRT